MAHICNTMEGKMLALVMALVRLVPVDTSCWMRSVALEKTELPDAPPTESSASTKGTPAANMVDSVRVHRAITDFSTNAPKIGTFDTNPDLAQAVKDGKVQWYIDQQPYLQGYMAITQLYLYKKNGNILGGGKAVLTGPSFVDSSNIDATLPFVKNNTR